jgi:hypothetical protein
VLRSGRLAALCNVLCVHSCAASACTWLLPYSHATHWCLSAALRPRASPLPLKSLLHKGPRSCSQRDITATASVLQGYFCVARMSPFVHIDAVNVYRACGPFVVVISSDLG